MQQHSEVARLLTQISEEYEAARQGLTGLAQGIGQHAFITRRMEKIAEIHLQISGIVGDGDKAMAMVADAMEETQIAHHDPELEALVTQLHETREFAIDPECKEQFRVKLLGRSEMPDSSGTQNYV